MVRESYTAEWRDERGTWQLPGCSAEEAAHDTHEAARATIEHLAADPEWADCPWRIRYEGPGGTVTERVR